MVVAQGVKLQIGPACRPVVEIEGHVYEVTNVISCRVEVNPTWSWFHPPGALGPPSDVRMELTAIPDIQYGDIDGGDYVNSTATEIHEPKQVGSGQRQLPERT